MRTMWLELRLPPLVVTICAAIAISGFSRLLPRPSWPAPEVAHVAGVGLMIGGALLVAAAAAAFLKARTTVDPRFPERTSRLLTVGVYRLSRNPMYLAFVLVLIGLSVFLRVWPGLLVIVAVVAYLQRFQIEPEERVLRRHFGAEYDAYTQRVSRWI